MKKLAIGLGIGIGIGLGIAAILEIKATPKPIHPDEALEIAKKAFAEKGNVSGSWIHMISEHIDFTAVPTEIYRGGITLKEGDRHVPYEFMINAITGDLLRVMEIS